MNNFPTVPLISVAFDSAAKQSTPTDLGSPSADDFSAMLASMWCGPAIVQSPTIEVNVVPETTEPPVSLDEEQSTEAVFLPLSVVSTPEVIEFSASEVVIENATPITERVVQTLPMPTPIINEQRLAPAESVSKMDTIESIPVEVYQTPVEVAESQPTLQTANQMPTPTNVARYATRDLVRPVDPEPYTGGVKTVAPVRRTPTFNIDLPGSPNSGNIKPADAPVVEISVDKVESANVVSANVASVAPATKPQPTDEVTAEAIRREANLVASYLAQSTRDSRENPMESIKAQVSGNGPEAKSNENVPEPAPQKSLPQIDFTAPAFANSLKKQITDTTAAIVGPQVAREIFELADVTPQRQTRSVRLRLRPEELGQVEVQLSRDASGKVSAQILVERESARAALAQSLPQLREALERAGLNVDRLQVSSETSSFAGNARDHHRQANDETAGTSFQSESLTANETPTKERVREHKLLSLSA